MSVSPTLNRFEAASGCPRCRPSPGMRGAAAANSSATASVIGYTVDEPSILIRPAKFRDVIRRGAVT